jgi:hypothetical protein
MPGLRKVMGSLEADRNAFPLCNRGNEAGIYTPRERDDPFIAPQFYCRDNRFFKRAGCRVGLDETFYLTITDQRTFRSQARDNTEMVAGMAVIKGKRKFAAE